MMKDGFYYGMACFITTLYDIMLLRSIMLHYDMLHHAILGYVMVLGAQLFCVCYMMFIMLCHATFCWVVCTVALYCHT